MGTPSDGSLQDHSQWFSPLGSSASRISQGLGLEPVQMCNTLPATLSAGILMGSNALGRDSSCSEKAEHAFLSSIHQGPNPVGATSVPPSPLYQPRKNSHRQESAVAALASGSALPNQMRPGAASLGSWVAFDEAAHPALPPTPQHLQKAWNVPPEKPPSSPQSASQAESANQAAQAQPVAASAGISAASSGCTPDQHAPLIPSSLSASRGSMSAQAAPASASDQPQSATDFDLLRWSDADPLGQSAGRASAEGGPRPDFSVLTPSSSGADATAASAQLTASIGYSAMPLRPAASSWRDNDSASLSSKAAHSSAGHAILAERASTGASMKTGSAGDELQSLRQQVKPTCACVILSCCPL